ncbi:hypothetical protein [Aeromicrobium massiliense]|uniref:hypothetical protein n=1 Tax=Aeromicrobium massiliense TaxID=1464554 RepID=UPI0002DE34E0|nr:hypothetical protein [Aeromicrobium massiliense]
MKKSTKSVAAVAAVVVVGAGAGAWWWSASADQTQRVDGTCAQASYQLETEDEDGDRVDVSFELQTAAPGERWTLVLREGDTVLVEGERMSDEDAELDIEAQVPQDGEQTFTVEATPVAGGDTCTAEVTHR